MTIEQLQARLAELAYPCYVVAYGPARYHRTMYRSEHDGVFAAGLCASPDEAFRLIVDTDYPGHYDEMTLITVAIGTDGTLQETRI